MTATMNKTANLAREDVDHKLAKIRATPIRRTRPQGLRRAVHTDSRKPPTHERQGHDGVAADCSRPSRLLRTPIGVSRHGTPTTTRAKCSATPTTTRTVARSLLLTRDGPHRSSSAPRRIKSVARSRQGAGVRDHRTVNNRRPAIRLRWKGRGAAYRCRCFEEQQQDHCDPSCSCDAHQGPSASTISAGGCTRSGRECPSTRLPETKPPWLIVTACTSAEA
jgi:hypothetical protein